MRTIELSVTDSSYIICTINNFNDYVYTAYKNVLNEIKEILKKDKKIKIENNKVYITSEDKKIIINNYKNNKDDILQTIINKCIEEKIKARKEYLRNKRIKRIKKSVGVTILTSTIFTASLINAFSNDIEKLPLENKSLENDINIEDNNLLPNQDVENFYIPESINFNNKDEQSFFYDIEEENVVEVAFIDRTDSEKFLNTKQNYEKVITKISSEYGIDPKIMLAIATQESGVHNINTNGAAIGLMQIELSVWDNQQLTAFNYKTNKLETISITKEKLKDLEFNIKTACMIFQNCLKNSNYHLDIAIQMYNFGIGNVEKTLRMAYGNNMNFNELLEYANGEWLEYRSYINQGDKNYLEHIFSYIEDAKRLNCRNENEVILYNVNNSLNKSL